MYLVSSVNKAQTSHRSERMAQVEANQRINREDSEVTIERAIRVRTGFYTFQPVAIERAQPKSKLTQQIAKEYVGMLGGRLKRNAEYGEYKVTFGADEYFASDLDDAIGTARIMAGGHDRMADAEEYLTLMLR